MFCRKYISSYKMICFFINKKVFRDTQERPQSQNTTTTPVNIIHKSIAGRYRPVRVADGPITARYRFIKNASWDFTKNRMNVRREIATEIIRWTGQQKMYCCFVFVFVFCFVLRDGA